MSRVVLGVGASHSTLMNTHWHEVEHVDRAERFRDALDEARVAIASARPDAVVIVGSNHFRGFWLDLIPPFTVGVGEVLASGEAGTPEGAQNVDTDLGRQLCRSLMEESFDVAFSARLQIDHGQSHAIQYLLAGLDVPIVPLVINVFAPPLPSLRRCHELGAALARAVVSDGADKRVVVVGSGGLSHRLPFPDWQNPENDDQQYLVEAWLEGRANWQDYEVRRRQITRSAPSSINPEFDREFLRHFTAGDVSSVLQHTTDSLGELAGNGAQEIRTWLVVSAATGGSAGRTLAYEELPEWLTGMAVAVLEPPQAPEEQPV